MSEQVYIEITDAYIEVAKTVDGALDRYYKIPRDATVGNIYRGKVANVTGAGAFVDIGRDQNAFLAQKEGLKPGDFVTVMSERDENGQKGCLLTEKISIAGKYCIVTPEKSNRFSRRLTEERRRELDSSFPTKGLVFRSLCGDADLNAVRAEAERLDRLRKDIISRGKNLYNVSLLYRAEPLEAARALSHDGDIIYSLDPIRSLIEELHSPRIKHGNAFLVIEKTEAMTVVDVNSGAQKDRYSDPEEMAFNVNLNAADAVARQLKLRNIGGLIAVDFISMSDRKNIAEVKKRLSLRLSEDDVSAEAEFSDKLCVALITRKKRYSSI